MRRFPRRRFLALLLSLPCAAVLAAGWQNVARLDCSGGAFVVDARPFDANVAGTSRVDLRYRYRDRRLTVVRYESYYRNLDDYLQRDIARSRNFGLNLDTSGGSRRSGYDTGDTLYLPPDRFSADEFVALADCIASNDGILRRHFSETVITSRSMLGLMKNSTGTGVTGIARLIHADAPIAGIYGDGPLIIVERGGRVLLRTNYTANQPMVSVELGNVVPTGRKRPRLHARARVVLDGSTYAADDIQAWQDRHGRRIREDYHVMSDASPSETTVPAR